MPRFRPYAGEFGSPLAFVVDKNLIRRHMTDGQRALVGAKLKVLFEEEAQLRRRAGLKKGSEFPVEKNSSPRGKHEENARSGEKAAQLVSGPRCPVCSRTNVITSSNVATCRSSLAFDVRRPGPRLKVSAH